MSLCQCSYLSACLIWDDDAIGAFVIYLISRAYCSNSNPVRDYSVWLPSVQCVARRESRRYQAAARAISAGVRSPRGARAGSL